MKKRRFSVVKNLTLIAFMINCVSVVMLIWYGYDSLTKLISSIVWFISQIWIMIFLYANFVYVPEGKIRYKKTRFDSVTKLNGISRKQSNKIIFFDTLLLIFGGVCAVTGAWHMFNATGNVYRIFIDFGVVMLGFISIMTVLDQHLNLESFMLDLW